MWALAVKSWSTQLLKVSPSHCLRYENTLGVENTLSVPIFYIVYSDVIETLD